MTAIPADAHRPVAVVASGLTDWQRTALILAAGTVGGLTYWIIQFGAGASPLNMKWYVGLPASMLLGAVASGVGVYFIANSDTTELRHTMAFALICGIFWSPVIESGRTFVQGTATTRQASDVGNVASALLEEPRTSPMREVDAKVDKTTQMTTDLLRQLPEVRDADARKHAVRQSSRAVDALGHAAERTPEKSIAGLSQVGAMAAHAGQDEVAQKALSKLELIRTLNPHDAILAERIHQATTTILSAQRKLAPAAAATSP